MFRHEKSIMLKAVFRRLVSSTIPNMDHISTAKNPLRPWIVLPFMWLPLAASFFYFVLFPGTSFGNSFYTGIKIFLLFWPIIAVKLILKEPFVDRSLDRQHGASIWMGTVFGLVTSGLLVFLVLKTPIREVIFSNGDQIVERIKGLGVAENFLIFAAFLSVIHAWLEEFFWRWFVYGQLRRFLSDHWAHLLAAIGFTSHHLVILSQFFPFGWALFFSFCVGVGGFVWSWLYRRTNSLAGPWVSHMIVDVAIMWVGWILLKDAGIL